MTATRAPRAPRRTSKDREAPRRSLSTSLSALVLATALGLISASAYLWAATPAAMYAMGWLSGCLSLGMVVWARREGFW